MNSLLPDDDNQLSDDELVILERLMEADRQADSTFNTQQRIDFRSAFNIIDELSAPIRTELKLANNPPKLEDYDDLIEIGRGGMGIVYKGLHKKTQRYDAIKVMRPDRALALSNKTNSLLRLQFLRESQLAARVAHEYIVPVYQVDETEDHPWFSMQLVDGGSLHELTSRSRIATERIVRYIEQIARAIDVVHRHGILHGDIKPQNILIDTQTDRPMVSDFGLAEMEINSTNWPSSGVAGTPAYMAPELANAIIHGGTTVDVVVARSISSDVYSLGATLWAALSGCSPCFENRTPREQLDDVISGDLKFHTLENGEIPPALASIIARCVTTKPSDRYSTAGVLAEELAHWLDRPQWNRHFPKLRTLLCTVVAPVLILSGVCVHFLLAAKSAELWIWLVIFVGYAPLFGCFLASQSLGQEARPAYRELWSIWAGHLSATASGAIILNVLCQPDTNRVFEHFYPFWATISSLVFFAKSGNFWSGYKWVGICWSLIAICMSLTNWAPILFGICAAITCYIIARTDRSFVEI